MVFILPVFKRKVAPVSKRQPRRIWPWLVLLVVVLVAGLFGYVQWTRLRSSDSYSVSVRAIVQDYRFSIPRWEVNALRSELVERLSVGHLNEDTSESKQSVLAYLDTAGHMGALEGHIERTIILSENRAEAYASVASLQEEVEELRAGQEDKRK